MTDPIQPINPPQPGQQGQPIQQGTTDDVLGGEDIFASIPEAVPEENVSLEPIPEETAPFEPIPEIEDISPISVPEVETETSIEEPVFEESLPEEVHPEENISEEEVIPEEEDQYEEETPEENLLGNTLQTDVQKKFGELFFTTKKIYTLKNTLGIHEESFDILGANNDKIFISYRFLIDETDDPMLFITKIEQDKETDEETTNELKFTFNQENASLEVMVNDTLLFDEIHDFTEDQKKKMQVVDKINKFTFLASEELRKIEKQIKEKEENEQERRKLQEIFRNF